MITLYDTPETTKLKLQIQHNTPFVNIKSVTPLEFEIPDYKDIVKKLLKTVENKKKLPDVKQYLASQAKLYNTTVSDLVHEALYITKETSPELKFVEYNELGIGFVNLSSYTQNRKDTMRRIIQNLKSFENIIKDLQKYEDAANNIKITEFIQDSKTTEITFEYIDPYEVFNSIQLSENIPFVKLETEQTVFKVFGSKDIVKEIEEQDEYTIKDKPYIIMLYKTDEIRPVYITFKKDMIVNLDLSIDDTTGKNLILGSIDINKTVIKETVGDIKGVFAILNVDLVREIFLELLMNVEPNYDKLFYVDESRQLGPKRGTVIYLIYEPIGTKGIKSFVSKKRSGFEDKMRVKLNIPPFTDYLNVRIVNAKTIADIERYKDVFKILVAAYNNNYDNIVKDYTRVIPSFIHYSEKEGDDERNIKRLQRIAPELFLQGFAKRSEAKHQPEIYDPTKKSHKKLEIMTLKNIGVENEDVKFVCPYKENGFIYPGLKINKMANMDKYEFIPNCYKDTTRPYKLWKEYEEKDIPFSDFKKSDDATGKGKDIKKKALTIGQKGLLPRNIYYILGDGFYRTGTPLDKNSFIHAVLLAADKDYINSNKEEYAKDLRRNFAGYSKQNIIQELWDRSDEEINKDLRSDSYFDSKLYIGFLEDYLFQTFKKRVRIFIFSSLEDANTTFEIPRYTQGYLQSEYRRAIIIYKHYGTEGDSLQYPHYELVTTDDKKIFKDEVLKKLEKYYNRCYTLYRLEAIKKQKYFDSDSSIAEISDAYGKVRILNFNEYKISMYVSPLAPTYTGVLTGIFDPVDRDTLMRFVKDMKVKIIAKDVEDGKVIGVLTDAFDYSYIYVSENIDTATDINEVNGMALGKDPNIGILKKTFDNRKIASFMTQFALFAFSNYIKDLVPAKTGKLQVDLLIETEFYIQQSIRFMKNVIVKQHEFLPLESRKLTMNNRFFENDKLIVDSKTTKNKLKWYLYYSIKRSLKNVKEYYNKVHLDDYYITPEDYTQQPNTTVLIGVNSLEDWVTDDTIQRKTVNVLDENEESLQFLSNWIFKKPVIVQNVINGDLKKAVYVSETYIKDGYNPGFFVEKESESGYNMMSIKDVVVLDKFDRSLPTVFQYSEKVYAAVLIV